MLQKQAGKAGKAGKVSRLACRKNNNTVTCKAEKRVQAVRTESACSQVNITCLLLSFKDKDIH
jgi:hypothetical protein